MLKCHRNRMLACSFKWVPVADLSTVTKLHVSKQFGSLFFKNCYKTCAAPRSLWVIRPKVGKQTEAFFSINLKENSSLIITPCFLHGNTVVELRTACFQRLSWLRPNLKTLSHKTSPHQSRVSLTGFGPEPHFTCSCKETPCWVDTVWSSLVSPG